MLDTLLLNQPHPQDLVLFVGFGQQICGQHFNNDIGIALLHINKRFKVGPAGFNRAQHVFIGMAPLSHIALNFPGDFNFRTDIKVHTKVEEVTHTLVIHRVQPLDDDNVVRLNRFWRVDQARLVVVDRLHDAFARLERLNLLIHEIKVVSAGVEGCDPSLFALVAIQAVIVVETDGRD